MNSKEVLALSNAMKYFQDKISKIGSGKQLEQHLEAFATLVGRNQNIQGNILSNIVTLIVKRYYQFSLSPESVSIEEYILVKFVQTVSKMIEISGKREVKVSKDHLVISISATISLTKNILEKNQERTLQGSSISQSKSGKQAHSIPRPPSKRKKKSRRRNGWPRGPSEKC